ncbi:MAG: DUF481 domain-containing protein [Planctomycetota bacterium]
MQRWIAAAVCVAGMHPCAIASSASNQPGERVSLNDPQVIGAFVFITLENEDVVRGTIVRVQGGILTLQHEVLGDLQIQTTRVVAVSRLVGERPPVVRDQGSRPAEPRPEPVTPLPPADPIPADPQAPATVPEPVVEPEPGAEWNSRIEIGLNGSRGNTERLNSQLAFRTTRVTEGTRLAFDANWRVNTTEAERVANRLTLNARNDWDLPESKWTLFLQAGSEFDEFREFDARVSGGAGFSYRFIESEDTDLSARIGVGFSRDIGGPEENAIPELITGFDLSRRLTERQRFIASGELFPDLDETGEFRSVLNARWEYKLDAASDLSLSVGVEHRFDTQTVNDSRTDVDYFVRLVLGF